MVLRAPPDGFHIVNEMIGQRPGRTHRGFFIADHALEDLKPARSTHVEAVLTWRNNRGPAER